MFNSWFCSTACLERKGPSGPYGQSLLSPCSAGYCTDSYSLNTYSDALNTFGNEKSKLFNTSENLTSENNVDLENEEIVKQTSRFFGLNLVRFCLIFIYSP